MSHLAGFPGAPGNQIASPSPAGKAGRVALTYFGVKAFSRVPFGGNPAVVCLLDTRTGDDVEGGLDRGSGQLPLAPDDGWMQRVGAEFNQPATAFLWCG